MAKKRSVSVPAQQTTDELMSDALALARGKEAELLLAIELLHLQAKYVRILVDQGVLQHPAECAEEFTFSLCFRLLHII